MPKLDLVAGKTKGSPTRRLDGDLLATVANQPRHRLDRAIIELRTPEPDWLARRHEPQRGCWRCDARHPGCPVLHLLAHHHYLCTKHRIWIGPPDHADHPQPSLDELPEVVAAQHRHLRLLQRLGPAATFDAVLTGFLICAHHWNSSTPRRLSTATPGTTGIAALSCSSRPRPRTTPSARLGSSLRPTPKRSRSPSSSGRCAGGAWPLAGPTFRDPIAHWMEQDCWQPPSLPNTYYRSLKTFAGPAFRKPAKDSDEKRRTSALWFSRHHRGGDAMLHHRTLTLSSCATGHASWSCSPRRSNSPRTPTRTRSSR